MIEADPETKATLIVGLGNAAMGDDGVGIHAVRQLSSVEGLPPGVRILEGSVLGYGLLGYLEGVQRLVLVDAMDMGRPAGTVVAVAGEDLPCARPADRFSLHGVGILEVLDLAGTLGLRPAETYFVGVQPQHVAPCLTLSAPVQEALPAVVAAARALLGHNAG